MLSIAELPKYEPYKESGADWLGEIPKNWTIRKISHVFKTVGSGTTPASGNKNYYDGGVPWVQTGDLNDGVLSSTKKTITNKAIKDLPALRVYKKGSLIIALYGATIGKLCQLGVDAATNQACCVMDDPVNANTKFVFYLLAGYKVNIISMAYGGGQPNISQDLIKSLRLPFPELERQVLIAKFLDKKTTQIDDAIAIKEQQIALLKERKQIIIQKAVTQGLDPNVPMKDSGVDWIGQIPAHWDIVPNKKIFSLKKNLVGKKSDQYELLSLTLRGVIKRDMENPEGKFPAEFDTYQKVRAGDFVFCLFDVEETPRAVGLSSHDGMITGAYTVFGADSAVSKEFLYLFYLNLDSRKMLRPLYRGLRNTIPKDAFLSFKTPLPSLREQKEIVRFVGVEISRTELGMAHMAEQIAKLKEYKATLINAAVTGKIKITPDMVEG